jgi:iron-sulfur cluster repair protein YtfE (RIC family)
MIFIQCSQYTAHYILSMVSISMTPNANAAQALPLSELVKHVLHTWHNCKKATTYTVQYKHRKNTGMHLP